MGDSGAAQRELLPFLQAAAAGAGSGQTEWPPLMTLGPNAQATLMAECRLAFAPCRWRRFSLRVLGVRRWYEESLQLWLASRSYLRDLPFPYPSVG